MSPETIQGQGWRGSVFYQIYPRSFQDTNGDGVGDLSGIIERLPYVASLGVDGIWLSPVFRSPMRDYGYDISDYCDIDPLFGTLQDFDSLVRRTHDLGLKLIVDQVYSHTSIDHPWFTDSRTDRTNPKADWYVWADPKPDGSPPTNWMAAFGGGMWEWEARRRQYYLHNFLSSQPDLNLHNPAVQDAVLDVARFWLDRGVDGFRLDVANCYTHDRQLRDNPPSGARNAVRPYFMQRHIHDRDQPETFDFAARLRAVVDEKPGRFLLAELAADDPEAAIAAFTAGDDRFHTAYAFRFLAKPFSAGIIRAGVQDLLKRAPEAWPSWAFSNHDFERVATRWGAGKPMPLFAKTLFALLTSLRGTAFVYQGEELGLPQADVPFEALRDPDGIAFWPTYKGRDGCRTPMPWTAEDEGAGFTRGAPWLPIDPAHRPLAVNRQEADPHSMLAFVRAWLAFRRGQSALQLGDIRFLDLHDQILAFDRVHGAQTFRLLFNLGEGPAIVRVEGRWREAFHLGGCLADGEAALPQRTALILERE
jgi:alpha-glucosidase